MGLLECCRGHSAEGGRRRLALYVFTLFFVWCLFVWWFTSRVHRADYLTADHPVPNATDLSEAYRALRCYQVITVAPSRPILGAVLINAETPALYEAVLPTGVVANTYFRSVDYIRPDVWPALRGLDSDPSRAAEVDRRLRELQPEQWTRPAADMVLFGLPCACAIDPVACSTAASLAAVTGGEWTIGVHLHAWTWLASPSHAICDGETYPKLSNAEYAAFVSGTAYVRHALSPPLPSMPGDDATDSAVTATENGAAAAPSSSSSSTSAAAAQGEEEAADAADRLRLPVRTAYRLSFSLLNADPDAFAHGGLRFEWDIAAALRRFLDPLKAALAPVCTLSYDSQVLHYTRLTAPDTEGVRADRTTDSHYVRTETLRRFVGATQWNVGMSSALLAAHFSGCACRSDHDPR
jgi:hypothetical protein